MQHLRPSSEAEMIALFLQQEYASHARYGSRIEECLTAERAAPDLITAADLANAEGNETRRRIFARYRGYGTGTGITSYLTDFPSSGVSWNWVALTPDDLLDSTMIRYIAEKELAANTRSLREAAGRINRKELASEFAIRVKELAARLRNGLQVPPAILVSADDGATRVILEGHTRLLAYALAPETIPSPIEVLLGTSPDIARWDEY
jgi:hypothetical protein